MSVTSLRARQLLALHRAALAIGGDLELERVLRKILRTGARLVHARYGALGVPDDSGGFSTFLTEGIPARVARRIGSLPRRHGVLGLLLTEGKAIRLRDIRRHPRFSGYPPSHPAMRDFLGVPIRYRGDILGNLYLSGSPRGAFAAEDQRIVELLAAHAGVAIATAHRYARGQELAAREERDRIARELHEIVAQALRGLARPLARGPLAPDAGALTERERAVLALLVEGFANKEIADRLSISEKTVKTHVSNILQKLGVADRTQAAVLAVRHRLIP